jgi:ferritin-like metal-binding protein YciE
MVVINEGLRVTKTPPVPNYGAGPEHSLLKTFFIGELKDIYWAEQKLVSTLPRMAAAATSDELRQLFTKHLLETQQHVARLEKAFGLMGVPAEAVKCEAMSGITEEGEGIIADTTAGTATRDVGLILAAQKAEHYEIATYGGLAQIAHMLGLLEVAGLLHATLDEEKGADKLLSLAASSGINLFATTENGAG